MNRRRSKRNARSKPSFEPVQPRDLGPRPPTHVVDGAEDALSFSTLKTNSIWTPQPISIFEDVVAEFDDEEVEFDDEELDDDELDGDDDDPGV